MINKTAESRPPGPKPIRQNGRLWFSKEVERRFFFILTMVMLVVGILYKTGIW